MFKHAGNRTTALSICLCFALLVGAWATPASGQIIAYWNFNDVSNAPTSQLVPSQGAGTITLTFTGGVDHFTGVPLNAQGGDPAGRDFALQGGAGLVNNGEFMIIAIDTTGFQNIVMSFACQRSSSGFISNQLSYSDNGGMSWTNFGAPFTPPSPYNLLVFDFSGITEIENNPDTMIRIQFNGATTAPGNNRIDNLVIAGAAESSGVCCFPDGSCNVIPEATCNGQGGTWDGPGGSCVPNECPQPTGACCDPELGVCTIELQPDCVAKGGVYQGHFTDCDPNPCVGACCDQGGSTCTIRTQLECQNQMGGGIYLGGGTECGVGTCDFDYEGVLINEIRIDQPGVDFDEYFELVNTSNETKSLNGLSYIVLRQTGPASASGRVKSVTDLSGYSIPAGGHFLVAIPSFTLQGATPDLVTNLIFENGENTTHMLVVGFYGQLGDVVDTNNDCIIDNPLWFDIIDRVALIRTDNLMGGPSLSGCHYGTGSPFIDTLKDGTFVPGHVFRCGSPAGFPCTDGSNFGFEDWFVGPFNPDFGDDTPGSPNQRSIGACCELDFCSDNIERQICAEQFSGSWLGRDTTCTNDGDRCQGACCTCQDPPDCTIFDCEIKFPIPCQNQGGVYQGGLTVCPPDEGAIDCADCVTLAEARAMPDGTGVRLCSVVVTNKVDLINSATSTNMHIADESGADGQTGLTVFGTNALMEAEFGGITEGDRISLQGTLGTFNGLKQLQHVPATRALALVNNQGFVGVPPPVLVTAEDFQDNNPNAENLESEIVTLRCVVFLESGEFAFITNYTVTDGTYNVIVRVSTEFQVDIVGQPIPQGPVTISGVFSQFGSATTGYQLLLRTINDVQVGEDCGETAACCLAGPTCRDDLTEELCIGQGGVFRPDDLECPPTEPCPDNLHVRINEIRIEQPGTDLSEYFELKGDPGTPLGDLTYIVLGDGPQGQSGWIEAVIPLTGRSIPASGYFLCTENTFQHEFFSHISADLSEVDLVVPVNVLNFENDDNVTHMLVKNFTGAINQNLDTNDDGVLDVTPWDVIVDKIAIIKEHNPPQTTEWHYGPPVVGPVGSTSPGHVAVCPSSPPEWRVMAFQLGLDDTPGLPNPTICSCAGCLGDLNGDGVIDARDIQQFVQVIITGEGDGCADIAQSGTLDVDDIEPFVSLLLSKSFCGLPDPLPFDTRIVTWNLLNYSSNVPNTQPERIAAYKRVLNYIKPDVLICQEVICNDASADSFLNDVLNAADGPGGYARAARTATSMGAGCQVLYYRTNKIINTGNFAEIATTPRGTGRWLLDHVDGPDCPTNPHPTECGQFYVYGMHLRAGEMEDADRAANAALIRADANNNLPTGAQFIYAGDLNLYTSAEGAWTEFTGSQMNNNGRALDPINAPGAWSQNILFAGIHTQSPFRDAPGAPPGAVGGGLDDRFDFMLISTSLTNNMGLAYRVNTYRAFGNDGNHFNANITDPPIIPEGIFIAEALLGSTDHLPVIMVLRQQLPPAE